MPSDDGTVCAPRTDAECSRVFLSVSTVMRVDDDRAYVIALVYAWLLSNPQYYSTYVAPYTQLRLLNGRASPGVCVIKVGGHYRRRTPYKGLLPALACACRFERLVIPRGLGTPIACSRRRRDENGELVPIHNRVYEWA